ncbi:hypothetical protein OkiPb00542_24780 [Escherichia coli]
MSNTQITSQAEKLALIRESERMTRKQVAELTGINYNTYAGYEQGKVKMSFDAGMKFFKPERFRKYRDWFMFDETDPAGGQIAPALAHWARLNNLAPLRPKDWLTIYSAYVCSKCTKENCINFQVVEVNSVIGGLYVY